MKQLPHDTSLIRGIPFRSKEVSWLSFNSRVLQEGSDPSVPLYERLKFLGIYSSNMDEFFRVRVATLKRLTLLGSTYRQLDLPDPKDTLAHINRICSTETEIFNDAYAAAMKEMRSHGIRVINDTQVPKALRPWLHEYFTREVHPRIMPLMIKANFHLAGLKDVPMYLAVRLTKSSGKGRAAHALLEIPSVEIPRFTVLPKHGDETLVMYLDDIIRFGLPSIFASLSYDQFESYAIKFTRDAELAFDDDITESFLERVSEGLRAREAGTPVRLNYDASIPPAFLRLLLKKLYISGGDTLFPGARYHNRKDLLGFPKLGPDKLRHPPFRPTFHPELTPGPRLSIFAKLRTKDLLLHPPYHSFNSFLDLLREASMDPLVRSISITQYRLASRSAVAKALITAVRAGKDVHVLVEPTARFDEEANIAYAADYQAAGGRVTLGVPGLKVHAKICLIERREGGRNRRYAALGTGNFNEDTAKLYTDHLLLTSDRGICKDVSRVFRFFRNTYRPPALEHLICAPFSLRGWLSERVEAEIAEAKAGRKAEIWIKINNLSDPETVALLYRASEAGVKLRLIVRSMFSVVTGLPGFSQRILAIGIVDRFLEHSRILAFHNGGDPKFFLSSADFLPRNFDGRVEIVTPVNDPKLQDELLHYLQLQWGDCEKARLLDRDLTNTRYEPKKKYSTGGRSQAAINDYLLSLAEPEVAKPKKKR